MNKKIYLYALFFLANNIFCLTPCSTSSRISHGFISPENELIIFNLEKNDKILQIYNKDDSKEYKIKSTINLIELPLNNSNESSIDFDLDSSYHAVYHDISKEEIIYFNKKYYFSQVLPFKVTSFYKEKHLSYIGNNSFVYLDSDISTILNIIIIQFNLNLENEDKYSVLKKIKINSYLIATLKTTFQCEILKNSKYIVCIHSEALTEVVYSLIILDSNYNVIYDKKIYEDPSTYVLFDPYGKIIPLNDQKFIIYYSIQNNIYIGLGQILSNSNINIKIEKMELFSSVKPKINSELVVNDNNIILGFKEYKENNKQSSNRIIMKMVNITLVNNNLVKDYFDLNIHVNDLLNIQFLEDNTGNVLFLMNYNSSSVVKNGYQDFEYSTCSNFVTKIYNGETTRLSFNNNIIPRFNTRERVNDIIFAFNGNLSSLLSEKYNPIKSGNIYNKNNIYFKLDPNDYEYIKNNSVYSVIYTTNFDEEKSQRCYLNLSFYSCPSLCELCSNNSKCYDRYWNIIDQKEQSNDSNSETKTNFISTFVFIIIIFIIILICIAVSYMLCCKNRNNINIPIANNNQDQAIINEYNYPSKPNQNLNNYNNNNNNFGPITPPTTMNQNNYNPAPPFTQYPYPPA